MTNKPHPHHDCLRLFEKLSEFIDHELDTVTCRDIERHMKNCRACTACMATLKKTVELSKCTSSHPVPESFSENLKNLIREMS